MRKKMDCRDFSSWKIIVDLTLTSNRAVTWMQSERKIIIRSCERL